MNLGILAVAMLFLGISCRKTLCKDDDLTLSRVEYKGSELKLNGYYFRSIDDDRLELMVLYRNGIIFTTNVGEIKSKWWESQFMDGSFGRKVGLAKYEWGLFLINNNTIKIEKWYINECGLPVYLSNGELLNDSTFILKESRRSKDGSNYRTYNLIYHFKKFSPKPDSTNTFIP